MCFMEFISVGYESTKYLMNRFVLQEYGILLGGCLTCEELSGSYSQEMMDVTLRGELVFEVVIA